MVVWPSSSSLCRRQTVTKKLAAWLAERGYADTKTAEVAVEQGAAAARDLPKAEALATRLATSRSADEVLASGRQALAGSYSAR